jgi:exodeoxyribonuclease VII small subunit
MTQPVESPRRPRPDSRDGSSPSSSRDGSSPGGEAAPRQPAAQVAASFEDATRRLGAIVDELESGDLPLERSLELFEEGVRLARTAQERLDKAERRVEELLAVDAKGGAITRDFEG